MEIYYDFNIMFFIFIAIEIQNVLTYAKVISVHFLILFCYKNLRSGFVQRAGPNAWAGRIQ